MRYNDCVVGCTTCGNLCLSHAITFPDLEDVRCIYKEHQVWSAVKKALIAEGTIPRGRKPQNGEAPDEEACRPGLSITDEKGTDPVEMVPDQVTRETQESIRR